MLSYETISDALLDSADEVGLNVWQSDEQLDPHTLLRTFALTCLPTGLTSPRPSALQVALRFRWDAALTAISTQGTDALCKLYHADSVPCSHELIGCAYEAKLGLEIVYTIPLALTLDEPTTLLRTVRGLQDLHRTMIDHKNVIHVDSDLHASGTDLRIRQLTARQTWSLGDALHDADGLNDLLEEVCSEVRDMLAALTLHFSGSARLPDLDELLELPLALSLDLDEDRVYLRPPTA